MLFRYLLSSYRFRAMNYYTLLITLGIFVTLIPNLGFPGTWKTGMLSVLGICIALLAYFAKRAISLEDIEEVSSVLPDPRASEVRAAVDVEVHHADTHNENHAQTHHTSHSHSHEEHADLHHIYTPHERRSHHI